MRKIDTNPIAALSGSAPVTSGKVAIPTTAIYDIQTAEEPLILSPYDGFELWFQYVPASSGSTTIDLGYSMAWEEYRAGSFPLGGNAMATQLVGNIQSTTAAEVGLNNKALYVNPRPNDYTTLGMYSIAAASGIMAVGLGAGARVFSFRYPGSNLVLLKRILLSAGNTATAFTAGVVTMQALIARSFTASDTTAGTDISPSGNANKKKTSMATSGVTGAKMAYIAATGAISGGPVLGSTM